MTRIRQGILRVRDYCNAALTAVKRNGSAKGEVCLIDSDEHQIHRSGLCRHAVKVLNRLNDAGHQAYIVGGGVRDLLLGYEPKDFDVATSATPEEVRRLFRNCRLIGRRFRLAHVLFGREIIEVATFRGSSDDGSGDRRLDQGRIVRDNVYGTLEEDAVRRDFTVNALYYGIDDNQVRDFAGGYDDLRRGVLRLIGDPVRRYREDPVRMLRAVRFAAKLGMQIDAGSEKPLRNLADLLSDIAPARLFEEVLKLFLSGYAVKSYELLRHYRLFDQLFPDTEKCLAAEDEGYPRTLLVHALENTDQRVDEGKPVTPAFLFAALLWEPMRERSKHLEASGHSPHDAMQQAAEWIISRQVRRTALPRRFSYPMREIWGMQSRLIHQRGKRARKTLEHPRFRAAYDFLLLRAESNPDLKESAQWWREAQRWDSDELHKQTSGNNPRKRRRRRRPRKRSSGGNHPGNQGGND